MTTLAIPKNVKITSCTKHDGLWIRATLDKSNWARIGVTRSGWRVSARGNMRIHAMMMRKQFEELLDANYTFGDAMEYMRLEMGA